jgi:hypothetical protein
LQASNAAKPPQANRLLLFLEKTQTLAATEETTPNLRYTVKLAIAHDWLTTRREFAGVIYVHQLKLTIRNRIEYLPL